MEQQNFRPAEIHGAYRSVADASRLYDGMITCSTPIGKIVCRAVWAMGWRENETYLSEALRGIPSDFSGRMLEVPVGTGVITMPVYRELPDAKVQCLDYSEDMLSYAKQRAAACGLKNVSFIQGDVGALPFADDSLDLVLSLNGFHAFPDKESAYREVYRVLKPGGIFCGCFYIAGECARTDWVVRHVYVPKGYFTPPFETLESLKTRLMGSYVDGAISSVKSMACFCCHKPKSA
jgi:SAM-dependent methyltransferase